MPNFYNIFKVLITTIVFLLVGWLLLVYFLNNTNIQVLQELFQSAMVFFAGSLKGTGVAVFLVFMVNIIVKKIRFHDSIRNIFKSHMATHALRKFAHTYGSKRNIDCPTETNETVTMKKGNASLQTLVVTYHNDFATMTITLPADHEAQKMIKALFPDMKAELNERDDDFLFSDIVRKKKRTYETMAKKVVDMG